MCDDIMDCLTEHCQKPACTDVLSDLIIPKPHFARTYDLRRGRVLWKVEDSLACSWSLRMAF